MAPSITSSETSFISPSTIRMLSIVPPTMMSRSHSGISEKLGLMAYSPLRRTTRTSEMGPPKGMSETASAAEAARPASASG